MGDYSQVIQVNIFIAYLAFMLSFMILVVEILKIFIKLAAFLREAQTMILLLVGNIGLYLGTVI